MFYPPPTSPARLFWQSLIRNSYVICCCKSELHEPAIPNYYHITFHHLIYICDFDILMIFWCSYIRKFMQILEITGCSIFQEKILKTPIHIFIFSPMFFYMHGRAGPVNFKLMVKEFYIYIKCSYIHKGNLNHSNMMPLWMFDRPFLFDEIRQKNK